MQDLKHSKASLKKMAKSLEKEREKLSELEAAPGKHQKEIQDMEKKLKILEVSILGSLCLSLLEISGSPSKLQMKQCSGVHIWGEY